MKLVTMMLPTINPQGKKIVMPEKCCMCTEASAGTVQVKSIDLEGTAGRPAMDVPYCEKHLEMGRIYYDKVAESNFFFWGVMTVRILSLIFVMFCTIILAPEMFPELASWHPIFLGVLGLAVGIAFIIFLTWGGSFYLYDEFIRKQTLKRSKLELSEAVKTSRLALGFGALSNQVIDGKLQLELQVLNDDFADLLTDGYSVKALD